MLQRRRNWMPATAARRSGPQVSPVSSTERARQAPAVAAKTMLAAETALGRTPAEASRRARKFAQARDRVFRGRRAGALSRPSWKCRIDCHRLPESRGIGGRFHLARSLPQRLAADLDRTRGLRRTVIRTQSETGDQTPVFLKGSYA
jgi:hypothetical protein